MPKRNGFKFLGWYYNDVKCDGAIWTLDIANVKLQAMWDPGVVYFNANGGIIGKTSQTISKDGKYGLLPIPERSGYAFLGWFTELNGGRKVDADLMVHFEGAEGTIYARWTKTKTTITLGNGQTDRHTIRIWSSWGHNDNWHGEDHIHTELNRDELISQGYTKIKVTMTFYYRVDDWGD